MYFICCLSVALCAPVFHSDVRKSKHERCHVTIREIVLCLQEKKVLLSFRFCDRAGVLLAQQNRAAAVDKYSQSIL